MVKTILVSSTREEAAALTSAGPRRDFVELAGTAGAGIRYRPEGRKRSGLLGRIAGTHVRQAWTAARDAAPGDQLLADGEHIGIPLALFLALRRKRDVRVVMLGHFVSKRWKVVALRVASRVYPRATVLVHSVRQRELITPAVAPRWHVQTIPYHVDTHYWQRRQHVPSTRLLVVAIGSEARDYPTLIEAARGLEADVMIAAGSHWARSIAAVRDQPGNIQYVSTVLSFAQLRDLYERAAVLVVPLGDVANQSGVTAILEAMSMSLPVVVTATEGQRELVSGPLVTADGAWSCEATADRGPWVLDGSASPGTAGPNGLYVPPSDSLALRRALQRLLRDPSLGDQMGRAGRYYAERFFDTSRYVSLLAGHLTGETRA